VTDLSLLPLARAHPPETAGYHVVTRVPVAVDDELVGVVRARIATSSFDAADVIYLVDHAGAFVGAIRIERLFGAPAEERLRALVEPGYPRVAPGSDQELVAARVLACGVSSAAVVDGRGHLLGAVPATTLLDILRHEHVEDLHRLAGIQREAEQTRDALEAPPTRRARHRLPWLVFGLGGSMLAAGIVSRFDGLLQSELAIAYFVPAIVYLADAIGTQTEAIVVRGLSLSRLPLRSLLAGELRTGLLIGSALGAAALAPVALLFGDWALAAAVSLSILIAGAVATSIGLLLPWVFQRIGSDPALGSGPVATIIQDVLSLLIYFAIAILILGSTG
jgi:magnesium transporter